MVMWEQGDAERQTRGHAPQTMPGGAEAFKHQTGDDMPHVSLVFQYLYTAPIIQNVDNIKF